MMSQKQPLGRVHNSKENRPHVFIITTDQQRRDTLGANGDQLGLTPHLNELAKEAVNYSNAYSPNPVCVPARLSILTGKLPHHATDAPSGWGPLKPGIPSLAQLLGKEGYQTAGIGKMHFLPYAAPRTLHGFHHAELHEEGRILSKERAEGTNLGGEDYHDYLHSVGWGGYERAHGIGNNDVHLAPSPLPAEHYESAWVCRQSLDWIKRTRQEQPDAPLFLWMSFTRPHSPFDPPEPYHRIYDPRTLPPPVGDVVSLEEKSPALRSLRSHYGWESLSSPEHIRLARAYYYGLVRFIDEQIGKFLKQLDAWGIRENSIIIFTSDHGEMLGDFGLFFKSNHLEASAGVPFIIRYPQGKDGGKQSKELVGLEDIAPTILSVCGLPVCEEMDGIALDRVLNETLPARSTYVSHTVIAGHSYMLRKANWKYIYSEADGFEELYNLDHDPHELSNIALSHPEILNSLREELCQWCISNGDRRLMDDHGLIATSADRLIDQNIDPYARQGIRWY